MFETPVIKSIEPFILFDLPEIPIEPKEFDTPSAYGRVIHCQLGRK